MNTYEKLISHVPLDEDDMKFRFFITKGQTEDANGNPLFAFIYGNPFVNVVLGNDSKANGKDKCIQRARDAYASPYYRQYMNALHQSFATVSKNDFKVNVNGTEVCTEKSLAGLQACIDQKTRIKGLYDVTKLEIFDFDDPSTLEKLYEQ